MTQKFVWATESSNVVYLQTAKRSSLKIDFYFDVFKLLKSHVLNI